jgi:hypothetical protein
VKVTPEPFPHVVIDGLWDDGLLGSVLDEVLALPETAAFGRYENRNEHKWEGPHALWGDATRRLYDQIAALPVGAWFGIPDPVCDWMGGGYHIIPPGGFLRTHVDFNRHPTLGLYRRLNCLVFLNHGWSEVGGRLELRGDSVMRSVSPEFNRTVIFATSDRSWHGHPTPADRWRYSFAAYFYSSEPPPEFNEEHSTVWAEA